MSTFWRLLGFLRPYRRSVIWSFVLAFGALAGTVLLPWLTGLAINSIRHGSHQLSGAALHTTRIVSSSPQPKRAVLRVQRLQTGPGS